MSVMSRVFCSAVTAGVILSISVPSYAVTSSSETITLPCPVESDEPTELTRPQEPKTQYSVTLNGFYAEGYSLGLITKTSLDFSGDEFLKMQEKDKLILDKITPNVEATCSSGKKQMLVLKLGSPEKATLLCPKGDGLLVEMYDPTIDRAKSAEFTVTTTRDDDEKIIKEVFEIKNNVTEGTFSKQEDFQLGSKNSKNKVIVTQKGSGNGNCNIQ
jgi:hypothetical protein